MAAPLAAAGWFGWLAVQAGRDLAATREQLVFTECCALILGAGAVALGLWLLEQAERSAARGGGLLGGLGVIPLAFGAVMLAIGAASWALRRTRRSWSRISS